MTVLTALLLSRLEVWSDLECAGGTRLAVLQPPAACAARVDLAGDDRLTVTLPLSDPQLPQCREQRVLRVVDVLAGTFDEWVIRQRTDDATNASVQLVALAPLSRLGTGIPVYRVVGSRLEMNLDFVSRTPADIAATVIAQQQTQGLPWVSLGTVDPTAAVTISSAWDSPLAVLRRLAEAAGAELQCRRVGTSGYVVDLLTQRGSTAHNLDLRYGKNLPVHVAGRDATRQGTRIVGKGATSDGLAAGLGSNVWLVTAIAGGWVVLADPAGGEGPIAFDAQLNGRYLVGPTGTIGAITGTRKATQDVQATLAGLAVGDLVRVASDASGAELTWLSEPAAEAVYGATTPIYQVLERADVPDVVNRIKNPCFRRWPGGASTTPPNWSLLGGAIVTRVSIAPYVKYGPNAAQLVAGVDGDGILSDDWFRALGFTAERPYASAHVAVWVVTGQVRVELVITTATGTVVRPVGTLATSSQQGQWIDVLGLAGEEVYSLTPTAIRLRVVQHGATPATWYLGGAQGVNSAALEPWVEGAGGTQLWQQVNRALVAGAARPSVTYRVGWLDLARLDPLTWAADATPTLGGPVVLTDPRLGVAVTTRLTALERDYVTRGNGALECATQPYDLAQFLLGGPAAERAAAREPAPLTGAPADDARAATRVGRQILSNPDFLLGAAGYAVYDNAATGRVTHTIETDATAPNTSGKVLRIDVAAGAAVISPGLGGVYRAIPVDSGAVALDTYHKGATLLVRLRAKIPVGFALQYQNNAFGAEGTLEYLTPMAGTGQWTEYVVRQVIGVTGSFSTIGHFNLAPGGAGAVTWRVAGWWMHDIGQVEAPQVGVDLGTGKVNPAVATSTGTGIFEKSSPATPNTLDGIPNGATYGRPVLTALASGFVDLSAAGVIGTVDQTKIAADAVVAGKIAALAVRARELAVGAQFQYRATAGGTPLVLNTDGTLSRPSTGLNPTDARWVADDANTYGASEPVVQASARFRNASSWQYGVALGLGSPWATSGQAGLLWWRPNGTTLQLYPVAGVGNFGTPAAYSVTAPSGDERLTIIRNNVLPADNVRLRVYANGALIASFTDAQLTSAFGAAWAGAQGGATALMLSDSVTTVSEIVAGPGRTLITDGSVRTRHLAADTLQTTNYAEDGSGNPTAGAKLDAYGTAVKIAPDGLKVGQYLFKDAWFRALNALASSGVAGSDRTWYRGNNDEATLGGAPAVGRLTVTPQLWDTTLQALRLDLKLAPTAASDNLDGLRYAKVKLYRAAARGAPYALTAICTFFVPLADRLYQTPGTDGAAGNVVTITGLCIDGGISAGYPAMEITLYNAAGPSNTNCYGPPAGWAAGTALTNHGTTWPAGTTGGTGGGAGGGGGGGGTCVTLDTPILLADGRTQRAADLVVGDRLRTMHEDGLHWGLHRVVAAETARVPELRVVRCRDGRELMCTPTHRVYVRRRGTIAPFGWCEAQHLEPGDILAGRPAAIVRASVPVAVGPDGAEVVKLTVEGAHTYVSSGLLSHNIKYN